MDYVLEHTSDWIIVRGPDNYPTFRHNSGDMALALADFRGIADALGVKLSRSKAEQNQDPPPADPPPADNPTDGTASDQVEGDGDPADPPADGDPADETPST